jgi:RNA polymerase sigma-70 factor, ECF subfamily
VAAPTNADELTAILGDLPQGDSGAAELNAALPALYDELRQMASSYLRKERSDHTLQPTALVHESYLRLIDQHAVDWKNRLHVLSIAARMMRRILSNYATARATNKRGEGEPKLELDAALGVYDKRAISVAAVDAALRDLENVDPRPARVVELRFFAGLTIEEIAELLNVSAPTVKREWAVAKRWLRRELSSAG